MQKRGNTFLFFLLFFGISLFIFLLSKQGVLTGLGVLGNGLFPLQSLVFHIGSVPENLIGNVKKEQQKMDTGISKAIDTKTFANLKADNVALRDQFASATSSTLRLVPAHVIGAPQFIPGVSSINTMIIDQGENSGIKKGYVVVYKDNLVGIVTKTTSVASLVQVVTNIHTSFTAKTSSTNALGVIHGTDTGLMILGNVVLSDQLQAGDLVTTTLGEDIHASGYYSGLIVGKIIAVQKNPSNIFQQASVQSLINFTHLSLVFIALGSQ